MLDERKAPTDFSNPVRVKNFLFHPASFFKKFLAENKMRIESNAGSSFISHALQKFSKKFGGMKKN
jgi:hypothetical protein